MATVSRGPLSPSSPNLIMQSATELERNPSVSCLHLLSSVFVDDLWTQDSDLGFFAHAQNILVNGGTFVRRSRRLHKSSIILFTVFTRSVMFALSILTKGG